jgi:uncharacterized membrane protein YeiH
MGAVTGTAGGMMRDVLCAEVPLILRHEIYATASVADATAFVLLQGIGAGCFLVPLLPIATAFVLVLRLAAIRFDLHVPPFPRKTDAAEPREPLSRKE